MVFRRTFLQIQGALGRGQFTKRLILVLLLSVGFSICAQTYVEIKDGRIRPIKVEFKGVKAAKLYEMTLASLENTSVDTVERNRMAEGKMMQLTIQCDSILYRRTSQINYRYDLRFEVNLRMQDQVLIIQIKEIQFKRSDRYWQKVILKAFNEDDAEDREFLEAMESAMDTWVFDLQNSIRRIMDPGNAPANISN